MQAFDFTERVAIVTGGGGVSVGQRLLHFQKMEPKWLL